jgi:hypothetical protein
VRKEMYLFYTIGRKGLRMRNRFVGEFFHAEFEHCVYLTLELIFQTQTLKKTTYFSANIKTNQYTTWCFYIGTIKRRETKKQREKKTKTKNFI